MVKVSSAANRAIRASAVAGLVLIALAAVSFAPPFGTWTRLSPDPIVSPGAKGSNPQEHLILPS